MMMRTRVAVMVGPILVVLALACPVVAAAAPDPEGLPDVCLAVAGAVTSDAPDLTPEAWAAVVTAVDAAVAARPTLIPDRSVVADPDPAGARGDRGPGGLRIGIWSTGGSEPGSSARRLEHLSAAGCPDHEAPWSVRVSGDFLRAGTKRELAAAPTTPGFESQIDVEWYPAEGRVRTMLEFSGPFGIPNGRCWMDDFLDVGDDGRARSRVETGLRTSPFAEGVCGRFEDHLSDGGAGAQAIMLLPTEVAVADGSSVRFVVDSVEVTDDAIVLSGSLDLR